MCLRKKATKSFGAGTLEKESWKEAEAFSWSEEAAKVRKCLVYTCVQFGTALKIMAQVIIIIFAGECLSTSLLDQTQDQLIGFFGDNPLSAIIHFRPRSNARGGLAGSQSDRHKFAYAKSAHK